MIVNTKHGEFEVKDLSRIDRRKHYRRVKEVYEESNILKLHDLSDEFVLIAFGNGKKADEQLGKLSAVQEDEVLLEIMSQYMGFDLGNASGD